MNDAVIMRFLLLFILLFTTFASAVVPTVARANPHVVEGDGFNLQIVRSSDHEIWLAPRDKKAAHNWFAAVLEGLPVGREMTFHVDMNETGADFKGNLKKWRGVHPVVSYADAARLDAFEWFYKTDDGIWLSGDALAEKPEAGRGEVPQQNAVPAAIAPAFLSSDRRVWSPWRDIENASADAINNEFSFSFTPRSSRATVALRVPYLNAFCDDYAEKLKGAKRPGVFVDELGKTPAGRPLRVFRFDDPNSTVPPEERQTVLVYAREQATDHDGSWVAHGLMNQLLARDETSQKLRADTTWLVIPIVDPDSAANSIWRGLQGAFWPKWDEKQKIARPEAVPYARYFVERANAGRTLDLNLGLYMLEGADNPHHIVSAFAPSWHTEAITYFNTKWFLALEAEQFVPGPPKPAWSGGDGSRIGGWLADKLRAVHGVYQINARVPNHHLSLDQTQFLGELSARAIWDYLWNEGLESHDAALAFNLKRLEEQQTYLAADQRTTRRDFEFDVLVKGFLPPPDEIRRLEAKWNAR